MEKQGKSQKGQGNEAFEMPTINVGPESTLEELTKAYLAIKEFGEANGIFVEDVDLNFRPVYEWHRSDAISNPPTTVFIHGIDKAVDDLEKMYDTCEGLLSQMPMDHPGRQQMEQRKEAIDDLTKIVFKAHNRSDRNSKKILNVDCRICDNCKAGNDNSTISKKPLGTCPYCKGPFYCNRACQRQHWKEGGHREACPRTAVPNGLFISQIQDEVAIFKAAVGGFTEKNRMSDETFISLMGPVYKTLKNKSSHVHKSM